MTRIGFYFSIFLLLCLSSQTVSVLKTRTLLRRAHGHPRIKRKNIWRRPQKSQNQIWKMANRVLNRKKNRSLEKDTQKGEMVDGGPLLILQVEQTFLCHRISLSSYYPSTDLVQIACIRSPKDGKFGRKEGCARTLGWLGFSEMFLLVKFLRALRGFWFWIYKVCQQEGRSFSLLLGPLHAFSLDNMRPRDLRM